MAKNSYFQRLITPKAPKPVVSPPRSLFPLPIISSANPDFLSGQKMRIKNSPTATSETAEQLDQLPIPRSPEHPNAHRDGQSPSSNEIPYRRDSSQVKPASESIRAIHAEHKSVGFVRGSVPIARQPDSLGVDTMVEIQGYSSHLSPRGSVHSMTKEMTRAHELDANNDSFTPSSVPGVKELLERREPDLKAALNPKASSSGSRNEVQPLQPTLSREADSTFAPPLREQGRSEPLLIEIGTLEVRLPVPEKRALRTGSTRTTGFLVRCLAYPFGLRQG